LDRICSAYDGLLVIKVFKGRLLLIINGLMLDDDDDEKDVLLPLLVVALIMVAADVGDDEVSMMVDSKAGFGFV
jgi:hypothetical protein